MIWSLNSFRWVSMSSTLKKGVIFGVRKYGSSSIICQEKGWGSSLEDESGEWTRTVCRCCMCMALRISLLAFYNSSFTRAVSSIILREASTSLRRCSWWTRAFSLYHSCSSRASFLNCIWSARESSLSWSCLVWASSRRRSCLIQACSRRRSCSPRWSSLACWRDLIISIIWCNMGASSPSGTWVRYLVFLISCVGFAAFVLVC